MQKTNLFTFISILFFIFTLNSFAQTDKEQKIDLSGKYALQFQIDRYFTLSDFQGGTISAKYHFNNNSALRFGITLGYEDMDVEISSKDVRQDTTYIEDYSGEESNNVIVLTLQYLHYLEVQNSISAFWGVGFNYSLRPISTDIPDYRIITEDYSAYGLDLLMGVEWFVRSNIGIHAEYGMGFGYTSSENSYERPSYYSDTEMNKDYQKTSGIELYNHSAKFGLSIYF